MTDCNFLEKGIEYVTKATEADKRKEYEEALKLYDMALKYFATALKYETNETIKETIRRKVREYLKRAEDLKEHLKNQAANKSAAADGGGGGGSPEGDEKEKYRKSLQSAILDKKPNIHWDDVAGLAAAKEMLQEAVILPLKFPEMYKGKRQPWRGILLYGPPGTGKSYLAKAVATESGSTFFNVTAADLVSKWLGEGEKLVRTLFELASEHSPAIIFIDEVDSMTSARNDKASETSNRMLNQFLIEIDGLSKSGNILVLGATNTPWALDPAMLRRFQKRVYIDLPDIQARKRIFEVHIGNTPNTLTKEDYLYLADQTEGFSGSDIANVVQDALMQPVRKVQSATHYRRVAHPDRKNPAIMCYDFYMPCSPGEPDAVELTWKDIPSGKIIEPPVSAKDFRRALTSGRSSVRDEDVTRLKDFTEKYGILG